MNRARLPRACILATAAVLSGAVAAHACQGPNVASPNRKCWAYYYKADFGVSFTTQAMVHCRFGNLIAGGGIVAYHDQLSTGIGLRWVSDHVLEIAVDPKATVPNEPVWKPTSARYFGRQLTYVYRDLTPSDPEWHGCEPKD